MAKQDKIEGGGKLSHSATEHQLNELLSHIRNEYEVFGTQKKDGRVVFDKLEHASDLVIPTPKTVIPFKKILWPNGVNMDKDKSPTPSDSPLPPPLAPPQAGGELSGMKVTKRKFAFVGLTNCDREALEILLDEFSGTDLLPSRDDLFIISSECIIDQFCFCTALSDGKIENFDLHIQKDKDSFSIFAGSKKGEKALRMVGIGKNAAAGKLKDISLEKEKIDKKVLALTIADKDGFSAFWQGIANNCFGCGACVAVCPLCFCFKQNTVNESDGGCKNCISWDGCFSKSFSEIQNHLDMRPHPVDRLYNWYHHKFVRAYSERNHFLCTGCGRCIAACPADLNQYRIISSIEKQKEQNADGKK